MSAEHEAYGPILEKLHHSPRAGFVSAPVIDQEAPWEQKVAGEDQAGVAIVVQQLCRMVTGRGQHIDDAVAEIDLRAAIRPVGKAKERAHVLEIRAHQLDAIQALEL